MQTCSLCSRVVYADVFSCRKVYENDDVAGANSIPSDYKHVSAV